MQYSTRDLFTMVAAAALLIGFAGLPGDFRSFLVVYALLFSGVGGCFYIAAGRDVPQRYVAVFVVLWTTGVVIAVLNEPR